MNGFNHSSTFTAPLGASVHRRAQQFCNQHSDRQKAQQVYLNTLAVCAVQFYLRCMEIETEQDTSDSWNPVMQALMDVADLTIPGVGKVECRPVWPDASVMQIPPEDWAERIGYVAVQLEPSLRHATVLGFALSAGTGEVPIHELRSLDDFLNHLQQLQSRVSLSQWLQGMVAAGWRSLDDLIGIPQPLILSFRNDAALSEITVRRAKLLNLGLQFEQQAVVLLVAVTPDIEPMLGISIQLHPAAGETYLPVDLSLKLLTETGAVLQQVRSRSVCPGELRSQDNYIQLKRFRGTAGERFDVQIAINDTKITESFTI
ncbi:MAG: DUF1822 family protein [Leptolyngbyaceae cyanobacterium RU_5_1]|nr:DUF1822 family protein [Leptolyngbyaceae cyanobacterium RU_5_1]